MAWWLICLGGVVFGWLWSVWNEDDGIDGIDLIIRIMIMMCLCPIRSATRRREKHNTARPSGGLGSTPIKQGSTPISPSPSVQGHCRGLIQPRGRPVGAQDVAPRPPWIKRRGSPPHMIPSPKRLRSEGNFGIAAVDRIDSSRRVGRASLPYPAFVTIDRHPGSTFWLTPRFRPYHCAHRRRQRSTLAAKRVADERRRPSCCCCSLLPA